MEHNPLSIPLAAKPHGIQPLDGMISAVLARDGRICQMCGADESDRCPYDTIGKDFAFRLFYQARTRRRRACS